MRFYIKTLNGTVIIIRDIEGSETIWELKRRVYEQTDIPIGIQRLIFAGRALENQRTLYDYNVESECTFHLIIAASLTHVVFNSYSATQIIERANPIELQYNAAPSPERSRGKSRTDTYLSNSSNYQEMYLNVWGEACERDTNPPAKKRSARELKYQRLIENAVRNKRYQVYDPPPKGWKKTARKVLPAVLEKCGFNMAEIQFIQGTKIFDVVDAIQHIKQKRIELIKPTSELTPLFIHHHDVVLGSVFPYFSLVDRMNFSLTCKHFNKMARQPVVWKYLCLLHDRRRITNKNFINILNQYGHCIHALSIQKCVKLTSESLKLIGAKCPNLHVLNAADNHLFEEDEQNAVFSKALQLRVINLSCTTDPTSRPIGRIDQLKELKQLNMAGRIQPSGSVIANVNLKVLDIRYCNEDLRIDCPQLERLFVEKTHSHPKHSTTRISQLFISYGASDPQSFVPINKVDAYTDEYEIKQI